MQKIILIKNAKIKSILISNIDITDNILVHVLSLLIYIFNLQM